MNSPRLDIGLLRSLEGHALFYPCSGRDLVLPVVVFGPWIADFWFVDLYAYRDLGCDSPYCLAERPEYVPQKKEICWPSIPEEAWQSDPRYGGQRPHILTETYCHQDSGKTIRVHRHMRRGPSALRSEIRELGVFFYRGDGRLESGSGTEWLTVWPQRYFLQGKPRPWLIEEVLDKLVDGGLIVTDGSNCLGENNPYRELARFAGRTRLSPEKAARTAQSFQDPAGRSFRCVGQIGHHYERGPGLVWQVTRKRPAEVCTAKDEEIGSLAPQGE